MGTIEQMTVDRYEKIMESLHEEAKLWKKLYENANAQLDIMTDILAAADDRMNELEAENKELKEKLEKAEK